MVATSHKPAVQDEFSSDEFRSDQRPSYPFLKTLNAAKVHGVLIPFEQAEIAGWDMEKPFKRYDQPLKSGETDPGIWIESPRMLVIRVGEMLRMDATRKIVGNWQKGDKERGYKPAQKFLIMFLDENNKPLHETPFQWTTKGVIQYEFQNAVRAFRREYEKVWAKARGERGGYKNDRFHALTVFHWVSGSQMKGSGSQQNSACVVARVMDATVDDYLKYFVGYDDELKAKVLSIFDESEGFGVYQTNDTPEPQEDTAFSEYDGHDLGDDPKVLQSEIAALIRWTGFDKTQVQRICQDNGLPFSSAAFTDRQQVTTLRGHLFLAWANSQGVPLTDLYMEVDDLPDANTDAWLRWQHVVKQKAATAAEPNYDDIPF